MHLGAYGLFPTTWLFERRARLTHQNPIPALDEEGLLVICVHIPLVLELPGMTA